MASDVEDLFVASLDDLDLDLAQKIAAGRCRLTIAPALLQRVAEGRQRFERFMARQGGYVYGTTTAPGARAKRVLSAGASAQQGSTLGGFVTLEAGLVDGKLPARTVRLALLARLTNALTGQGKLTSQTVTAVGDLIAGPPPTVPLNGLTGPGEVMLMGWLLSPLRDRPLAQGEAMALMNGSPFATAMVTDVALTGPRQLTLAGQVFALSAEAARMPRGHFNPGLAIAWPDPFYAEALSMLDGMLQGGATERLAHQAPVAWRVTPNSIAEGLRVSAEAAATAKISLRALKDNPTFVLADDEADDVIVSSGGYHDQRAGAAINAVNAAWSDLATVAYRQTAKLIGGVDLGLPLMLSGAAKDGVGSEFIVWTLTSALARARRAAEPAGLDLSVEDPGGNQSDVAEPAPVAYSRHLEATAALNDCLAALYVSARLALEIRGGTLPTPLQAFCDGVPWDLPAEASNAQVAGAPMRAIARHFDAVVWGGEG